MSPTATHLLRALLREASYLPDAAARCFVRQHVVNRFRAYQPWHKAPVSTGVKRRPAAILDARTRPKLRQAHKALNFLRRANQGEIPCLHKVLLLAYGRMGKRKHALLSGLLKPDPNAMPTDPDAPSPLQVLYDSNKRYLRYFDAPKAASKTHLSIGFSPRYSRLRAVVASQSASGIALHRDLKGAALKTPINNVWERPMPIKRARNNVRRWYALTMSRLLPPLPTEEWDQLHAMATGERPVALKRRRTAVPELDMESAGDHLQFQTTVLDAIALRKPSRADKPAGIHRPHAITEKFMRRLYTKVLALCCKLEYNVEQQRWIVIRTASARRIRPNVHSMPTDEALFAGVDDKGRVPKPPTKTKATGLRQRNAKGDSIRFPFFTEFLPKDHPMRINLEEWKKQRSALAAASESDQIPGR